MFKSLSRWASRAAAMLFLGLVSAGVYRGVPAGTSYRSM